MAAEMSDSEFAAALKKPHPDVPQNTPFSWIVTFTCNNDADYLELLALFTSYRPLALATGAKEYNVVKSVKGRNIVVYEVRQVQAGLIRRWVPLHGSPLTVVRIMQVYDGPNAAEVHHKVHTNPEFNPAHNRIRRIHVSVSGCCVP